MFVANSIDCTIKTQQIVRETPNYVVCEFETPPTKLIGIV